MYTYPRTDIDRIVCNTDAYKNLKVGDVVYVKQLLRKNLQIFGKMGYLKKENFLTLEGNPLGFEFGYSTRWISYQDVKCGMFIKSTMDIDWFIRKDRVYKVVSYKSLRRGLEEFHVLYLQDIRTNNTNHKKGYHQSNFMVLLDHEIRAQKILDFITE